MMDLRYHLASLMSVFLALAVGIVVGVSLGSSERQAATIQRLQQDFAVIRAEDRRLQEINAELRRRLEAHDAAERELMPLAIRGRLSGNRVALVLVGDAASALVEPVREALRLAGAEIGLTARLPRGGVEAGSISSSGSPAASPAASTDPNEAERVAAALTRALVTGQSGLLEGVRARSPELEVTGDLHAPVRRLLLLCTNEDPDYARLAAAGRGVEITVARIARERDALLVAAEPEARLEVGTASAETPADGEALLREPTSLLPALAGLGATTIDHVDTAIGQIAMVLALGSARGRFGTGSGASRVMPPLPSP